MRTGGHPAHSSPLPDARKHFLAIDKDCQEYLEAKRLLKFLDYFLPMPSDGINQNSILREFIGGSCFNV